MPLPERPQLRPYLSVTPDESDRRYVVIGDRLRQSRAQLRLSADAVPWLRLFDGRRTLPEIQAAVARLNGGQALGLDVFRRLVAELERARFLDGDWFRELLAGGVRPGVCFAPGADPEVLRRQMRRWFVDRGGPGLPGESRPQANLRALLAPHIDYPRGGRTYAWGYKELFEQTSARLFVIIGTAHYSRARYTLTRRSFRTILGQVETDQAYIDRLVAQYGDGLFADEIQAHMPEHSIELEVVFLQYLYEGRGPFRIVPLLVGGFHDCVNEKRDPSEYPEIARMVEALRHVERETPEPICYVISGDLAHIGPKFADPDPVHPVQLQHSLAQDQAILRHTEPPDPAGYFRVIADEGDARRICGLPPTWTLLEAIRPRSGRILDYDQYIHPQGFESVSFASVAFYD
jgi:AmmeMemoRadiSam system protein B